MTIQEAQQFFAGSEFTDETKKKISAILSHKKVLDPPTIIEIKAVMHEELAHDIKMAGVDVSDTPKAEKLERTRDANLSKIDSDLQKDMAFVDSELNELDRVRKGVMRTSDEMDADDIKKSL